MRRWLSLLLLLHLAPAGHAQDPVPTPSSPASPSSGPLPSPRALGSSQLVVTLEQRSAYLNGEGFAFSSAPRLIGGRGMVPLREVAQLLGLELLTGAEKLGLGRLELSRDLSSLSVGGVAQDPAQAALFEGQYFVSLRTLADALEGVLGVSADGRTLTLTLLGVREGDPAQPMARFATNKSVYAQGEPVLIQDYSYDPDGLDFTGRKWSGRQPAYFVPGEQTLTLVVTNQKGVQSAPFSRRITISNERIDSPLTYALKYTPLGSSVLDSSLPYPRLLPLPGAPDSTPLLFSDSPETVPGPGLLYRDSVRGAARIIAHHVNGSSRVARVFVTARNQDLTPLSARSSRLGETAPARFAGTLGQATLLDYFADSDQSTLSLEPEQSVVLYSSPPLAPGAGMNLMLDLELSGQAEISVLMLEQEALPTPEVLAALPTLPPDGRHVRGTFVGAVRRLSVDLGGTLPAKLVLGDSEDPSLSGMDALTRSPVVLRGNYGVLYDITLNNAAGVVGALAARGGLYKGAISVSDLLLERTEVLPLPLSGVLADPNQPLLFLRANAPHQLGARAAGPRPGPSPSSGPQSSAQKVSSVTQPPTQTPPGASFRLLFVPASGSSLPVHLVFYRPAGMQPAAYQPQPLPRPPAPVSVPTPEKPPERGVLRGN